ncbi:hypothetical protein DFH08DRAFT_943923 [Mycena albidolilacea]|uniref:Uncharacterized protein n=1 Tax=Mycena albidolilacea TaxID=1033008 RepID=A0AAD6Z7G8_9AGAR|nr:hypothetical protein DFH08DRAFT_943923 [Mycena albidolilacea]
MFNPTVAAFLVALSFSSLASASVIQPRDEVVMFNGQNVTFNYTDSIVPEGSLFGMGLLRTGALVPLKVTSENWRGPVILNIDDMDEIPATYLLQWPFFQNGSSYTAQLFQYNEKTLDVLVPNVRNATFTWVNIPGRDV